MHERKASTKSKPEEMSLTHVQAILEAGQILASALSSDELQHLSEPAVAYPYQPLTLSEGHRKIGGIINPSEETA